MAGLTGAAATAMSGGDDLENERGGMGAGGTYMVDTAPVRRDKGVVSATFEVVIGTRDSERRKGKQKEEEKPVVIQEPPVAEPAHHHEATTGNGDRPYSSHPPDDDYWGYNYHDWSYDHSNGHGHGHWDYHEGAWDQPPQVPMPHIPDNSQLSEKELARRAEERLLPSQPPGMEQQAVEGAHEPTAPYLPGEHVPDAHAVPTPAYESRPSALPSGSFPTPHSDMSSPAPEYFPVAGPSNHVPITRPTDDKQEMQRRQLEAEASAPPVDDEDLHTAAARTPSDVTATAQQPSAPSAPPQISPNEDGDDTLVPTESDLNHDSHADASEASDLPRYEPKDRVRDQGAE